MMENVNLIGVIVAAVASMVVGFIWYGPLFGKPWAKLMGWNAAHMEKAKNDKAGMMKTYGMSFVGSIFMAFVLSMLIGLTGKVTMMDGVMLGFWSWLGFVMPVQMTDVLFGGKSWNLFMINTGYQLASLLVMGATLTLIG